MASFEVLDAICFSLEEDSTSLYDKICDGMVFNSQLGKYEVSLPFKDDVRIMDDEYESSKSSNDHETDKMKPICICHHF